MEKVSVGTITSEGTLEIGNQTEMGRCPYSRSMNQSQMSCSQEGTCRYRQQAVPVVLQSTRSLESIRKRVAEIRKRLDEEEVDIKDMQNKSMMAQQPQQGQATDMAHAAFKAQARDYTQTGQYYVTPEVVREVRHLDNGVNHIRLDKDFVTTDKTWGERWRPKGAEQELAEATASIQEAAGTVAHVKGQMKAREISSLQDNQVRQRHHETISNLRGAEATMGPYAHHSIDRLKQYADFVGVTDRYTGYRNNLNRGAQEPNRMGRSWVERQQMYNPMQQQSRTPRHPQVSAPPYDHGAPSPSLNRAWPEGQAIPEMAGINTRFPGKTEYTDRYVQEPKSDSNVPFTVNPQPDMNINDRASAQVMWEPRSTEYQRRYNWPDSSAMSAMPWTRY